MECGEQLNGETTSVRVPLSYQCPPNRRAGESGI